MIIADEIFFKAKRDIKNVFTQSFYKNIVNVINIL